MYKLTREHNAEYDSLFSSSLTTRTRLGDAFLSERENCPLARPERVFSLCLSCAWSLSVTRVFLLVSSDARPPGACAQGYRRCLGVVRTQCAIPEGTLRYCTSCAAPQTALSGCASRRVLYLCYLRSPPGSDSAASDASLATQSSRDKSQRNRPGRRYQARATVHSSRQGDQLPGASVCTAVE